MVKRMLIISEYLAPAQAIASIRWTKMAKFLQRTGEYEIDVLTNRKCYDGSNLFLDQYLYDSTIAKDGDFFNAIYELDPSFSTRILNCAYNHVHPGYHASADKRSALAAVSTGHASSSMVQDSIFASFISCAKKELIAFGVKLRSMSRIRGYARQAMPKGFDPFRYDVIVSTCGPRWPHMVAHRIKKANPYAVWVADFRDVLAGYMEEDSSKIRLWPSAVCAQADVITGISPSISKLLYLDPGLRFECIYNGFDPDDCLLRERVGSDTFDLVYTGTLYSEGAMQRDLTPVLEAVNMLVSEGELDSNKVRLVYAGGQEGLFYEQCSAFPSVQCVSVGEVPRQEALRLQGRASILVLAVWNTEQDRDCISGKIYEYLSASAPIVSVCSGKYPGAMATEMVERSKSGVGYEEATRERDSVRLRKFILEKYLEWRTLGVTTCACDGDYVAQFSYEHLAARLNNLINELFESK